MKVLAYGEIMMRLEVPNHKLLHQSHQFDYSFGGTGLNVLTGLSNFGVSTRMLSSLPDNNLGDAAKRFISALNVDTSYIRKTEGYLGTYILEQGYGFRPSEVTYQDRSLSSFNTDILSEAICIEALDGVSHLHICGIALVTSEISKNNVLKLISLAKEKGITIVFDFNYRPKLSNNQFSKESYESVLKDADIVFGSKHDLHYFIDADEEDVASLFRAFMKKYQIKVFARTMKDKKAYNGFVMYQDRLFLSTDFMIDNVLESIGTGDAFASRLLAGIMNSESFKVSVEKATISGILSHSLVGDVVSVNEKMVDAFNYESYARIIR